MEDNNQINNNVENTNQNVIKEEKPKIKKKHRFLKFLLFLLIVFILIKGIKFTINYIKEIKYKKFIEQTYRLDKIEDIVLSEEELNMDINNEGLTIKEKKERKLDLTTNDTDGDGLSDYDEIYKYNSDPKKFSTSGDLLSDYYKVSNGYDINKKYNEVPNIETGNKDVILTPKTAEDIQAYYKEYEGNIPNELIPAFKPFRVYSFTGQAKVNIEDAGNYEVYSYNNIALKYSKLKSKSNKNEIVFDIKNDYPIIISYKKKVLEKLNQKIQSNINSFNNKSDSEYIVISMPLVNYFLGIPIYVYQVNDFKIGNVSNTDLENQLSQKSENKLSYSVRYINRTSAKLLDRIFGQVENKMISLTKEYDSSILKYIFNYRHLKNYKQLNNYLFADANDNDSDEEYYEFEEKFENTNGYYYADSGFDQSVNAFRFQNLSTNFSPGGVCAGFAHITTSIYNDDPIKDHVLYKYDLSTHHFNDMWKKKLHDYVPEYPLNTYSDDDYKYEKLDSSSMNAPDGELVKALEYYWDVYNNKSIRKKVPWALNSSLYWQTYISSNTVHNLVDKFKEGQIVSVTLLDGDSSSQHAVNAYKIVQDENDIDTLYLKIYDNNYPGDLGWDKNQNRVKIDVSMILKRNYKKTWHGIVENYTWEYSLYNKYGNMNGEFDGVLFIDENYNKL